MDAAGVLESQERSTRAHLTEIVVEFGIDRLIQQLSQIGTLIQCVHF